jgi:hypothetical protein
MINRPQGGDEDEAVQEAAEHAELTGDERQEMVRKASLAGAAENAGERDELESDAQGQAAEAQEAASADRAADGDGDGDGDGD